MIELINIGVTKGRHRLLRDVSLRLEPATFVAVVGPNGAGKSTLLRVISGTLKPTHGEVRFLGQSLELLDPLCYARSRAVVSQRAESPAGFSVGEIVHLGRLPHQSSLVAVETHSERILVAAALARVGMESLADRDVATLSGGERQRVELARAWVQLGGGPPKSARLLLLDEPTSSLDLHHQHQALTLAREAVGEGMLVVAVLHDLNLAAQYADQVIVLDQGRVAAEGTVEEVLDSGTLEPVFGVGIDVLRHPRLGCPLVVSRRIP